jgi:hypothetical protein
MGRILPDLMGRINTNFVLASEIIKVSVPSGAEAKNINRRANKLEYWNNGILRLIILVSTHHSIIPLFHYSFIPFFLSLRAL